ncbi:MAG: sugar phosphate isomerase/epimerase family protein [Acidimicrobiales bacterium]
MLLSNCAPTLLANPFELNVSALDQALAATRNAGFDAVGLWAFHIQFGGDAVAAAVADAGLSVVTIDAALAWVEGPSAAAAEEMDGLIAVADQFGAPVIHATTLGPVNDLEAAKDGYAAIAAQAEAAGKVLGLEFLPWTGIPTLAAANEIAAHGGSAAGILLDTWHWFRQPGGPDLELLRSIPGERITSVQLSDAPPAASADVATEAMTSRLLPGAGIIDFSAVWDALEHSGATPVVAAEVLSDSLKAEGPEAMARAVHDASRRVLPR